MTRGRANGRHVGTLTVEEAEARTSAIEKIDRRTGPRAAAAVARLSESVRLPLEPWQVRALEGLHPPLNTIGHVLQAAAAGNA